MSREISESDWKRFRTVRVAALDRFCQKALSDVRDLIAGAGKTHHERYLAVYQMIHERDKKLARIFDDPRRSVALEQLMAMRDAKLVTNEEFSRFSPELRARVEQYLGIVHG